MDIRLCPNYQSILLHKKKNQEEQNRPQESYRFR